MSEEYADPRACAADGAAVEPAPSGVGQRRFQPLLLAPVVLFAGVLLAFALSLGRDPGIVPSPLIGKPVPKFSLPPVKGHSQGLSSADLHGDVSLVNVFASWCVACREEHPLLMRLKREGLVPLYGIDYKDKPEDAMRWFAKKGDPYQRSGADLDGRLAIDWGVYGVPESFIVDRRGRIAFKQIGPITPEVLRRTILPLIQRLQVPRPEAKEGAR